MYIIKSNRSFSDDWECPCEDCNPRTHYWSDEERPLAVCIGCKAMPSELHEYSPEATGEDMSAEDYVWQEEGTLNTRNGHFLCTKCYIGAGMPSSPTGWKAP